MNIDRKFQILAISKNSGTVYDEENAILFLARDPALVPTLVHYKQECIELGCDAKHINSIQALIFRIKDYQDEHGTKTPAVETEEEFQRLTEE